MIQTAASTPILAGPAGVPSCVGAVCGNDGCGGSCGACAPGAACVAGACACTPDSYKGCCGDAVCQFDSCGAKGAQGEA